MGPLNSKDQWHTPMLWMWGHQPRPCHGACRWILIYACILCHGYAQTTGDSSFPSMHAIITTQCGRYFSWQSLGFFYSWRKIYHPGDLTRVLCCTEDAANAEGDHLHMLPTWVAPDYTNHPRLNDQYLAYNKPEAVIDWTQRASPTADYVLVIDADMIMNRIMNPVKLGVEPGWAVAAYFDYMIGTDNELAERHIPELPRRNDTLAGRRGRRSDMCGGWTFMTRDDITRVGPLWLKYTEDVRFDDEAWHLTGDVYATAAGMKPWIAEMYGYSYGAAKAGVYHKAHKTGMMYPGYYITEAPYVLHYGLHFDITGGYGWDKHAYFSFDPHACPPWDFQPDVPHQGGLFPHPPMPRELTSKDDQMYTDLHAIYVINTLNEAFCEQHYARCPPSEELDTHCGKVHTISLQLYEMLYDMEENRGYGKCRDVDPGCPMRASAGECESNMEYASTYCRNACKQCDPSEWTARRQFIAPWQHRFMQQQDIQAAGSLGRKGGLPDPTQHDDTTTTSAQEQATRQQQQAAADEAARAQRAAAEAAAARQQQEADEEARKMQAEAAVEAQIEQQAARERAAALAEEQAAQQRASLFSDGSGGGTTNAGGGEGDGKEEKKEGQHTPGSDVLDATIEGNVHEQAVHGLQDMLAAAKEADDGVYRAAEHVHGFPIYSSGSHLSLLRARMHHIEALHTWQSLVVQMHGMSMLAWGALVLLFVAVARPGLLQAGWQAGWQRVNKLLVRHAGTHSCSTNGTAIKGTQNGVAHQNGHNGHHAHHG